VELEQAIENAVVRHAETLYYHDACSGVSIYDPTKTYAIAKYKSTLDEMFPEQINAFTKYYDLILQYADANA
jgi:hypothetical protein